MVVTGLRLSMPFSFQHSQIYCLWFLWFSLETGDWEDVCPAHQLLNKASRAGSHPAHQKRSLSSLSMEGLLPWQVLSGLFLAQTRIGDSPLGHRVGDGWALWRADSLFESVFLESGNDSKGFSQLPSCYTCPSSYPWSLLLGKLWVHGNPGIDGQELWAQVGMWNNINKALPMYQATCWALLTSQELEEISCISLL